MLSSSFLIFQKSQENSPTSRLTRTRHETQLIQVVDRFSEYNPLRAHRSSLHTVDSSVEWEGNSKKPKRSRKIIQSSINFNTARWNGGEIGEGKSHQVARSSHRADMLMDLEWIERNLPRLEWGEIVDWEFLLFIFLTKIILQLFQILKQLILDPGSWNIEDHLSVTMTLNHQYRLRQVEGMINTRIVNNLQVKWITTHQKFNGKFYVRLNLMPLPGHDE